MQLFRAAWKKFQDGLLALLERRGIPPMTIVITLACIIGVLAGYGAALFTLLIHTVSQWTVESALHWAAEHWYLSVLVVATPALGLIAVSWFTRRFAPEAQGHGVPEVIVAVARHDGVIRPRVSLIKILASGFTIGTGGSVGREGPIVQIGSSIGSSFGQYFRLSSAQIKVLVACGAAGGISATFNAPLAGVIFASEIILGSFAVQSLTPIVIASVLADVVQFHVGEHGVSHAFQGLQYKFLGNAFELPAYFVLGLLCGVAAVSFTKLVYATEDASARWLPHWWMRALVLGGIVGVFGVAYPSSPPQTSTASQEKRRDDLVIPPLFGVGYEAVDHALHLENASEASPQRSAKHPGRHVRLNTDQMLAQLLWLLPLFLLKPIMTSITLAGGGSGGIFAPSLFIGATLGACFGLVMNLLFPQVSGHPGIYAVVGMGAVVAGTTHGTLSAILIVYEMTGEYSIILPIMVAAGLAGVVARWIDPDSIYHKKLSRRGESLTRGHHLTELEHIKVRQMMLTSFPSVSHNATASDIVEIAKRNPRFESFPVMDANGQMMGIIRPEDLHRLLDSDIDPHLVRADDIVLHTPLSVRPDANLLEALRDFGSRDVETLPVEVGTGAERKLVGLLLRNDVMKQYREELLRLGS